MPIYILTSAGNGLADSSKGDAKMIDLHQHLTAADKKKAIAEQKKRDKQAKLSAEITELSNDLVLQLNELFFLKDLKMINADSHIEVVFDHLKLIKPLKLTCHGTENRLRSTYFQIDCKKKLPKYLEIDKDTGSFIYNKHDRLLIKLSPRDSDLDSKVKAIFNTFKLYCDLRPRSE